jgi:hypothetical protein
MPRQRDTTQEAAVFFTEADHLFIPAAGAVDGLHQFHVRPAQGEIRQLQFSVPSGNTIADVQAEELPSTPAERGLRISSLEGWGRSGEGR